MSFSAMSTMRTGSWPGWPGSAGVGTDKGSSSGMMGQNGSSPSSSKTGQGSILIVDDDASVRRALHTTLRSLGFSTSEASGGEEALLLARTATYDVVLL